MFWGVTLESGKRYSQVVETAFHLSMAALEPTTKEVKKPNHFVSVMIEHGNAEFLLCTLEHGKLMQVALDLLFVAGEELSFFLNGDGTVHLTGYVIEDDDIESNEDDETQSIEDEELIADWSSKKGKKRKSSESFEETNVQKKGANESLKQHKGMKKSPKVDIVEVPSPRDKFAQSKSPFANKANEIKSKQEKKTPQNNGKFNSSRNVEESSDEEEDESESDAESDDAENDSGDDSDNESSMSQDDDVEDFMPKPKKLNLSGTPKDTILVAKQKNLNVSNESKKSPGFERGDSKNQSFSGKQNKDQKFGSSKKDPSKKQALQESPKSPKAKLQGGVEVEDVRVGNGPVAKPGKHVHVYYVGKLPNNKEFDSVMKGKPFSFRLGKGEVIKGWDVAIQGMKVGGKRKVTVPPHMGYGNKSQGPIPANSTLSFEVELKAVS